MTTAHRPTWVTAKGGGTARDLGRTVQYSSRDLPGHLNLKERQRGQGRTDEVEERDLKQELLERERENAQKRKREARTFDGTSFVLIECLCYSTINSFCAGA